MSKEIKGPYSVVCLVLLSALISAGCVSRVVPPELRYRVNRGLQFEEIVSEPDHYRGELVVLGGVLVSAKNMKEGTELEILQKPLTRTDEPRDVDESEGRFLAVYAGYLETSVYVKDRRVTVVGEVAGVVERPIGEMVYRYPLIRVQTIRLWPKIREPVYSYPYDPFYYPPWWYRYPYYGYPYHPFWP